MPQLEPDAISQKDLSDFLETADDFRFEMQVFRVCAEAGMKAQHGGTYRDPITEKDRQFDIRARWKVAVLQIEFAIECKNLRPNYPLLISRMPRTQSEAWHEIISQSQNHALSRQTITASYFRKGDGVGKCLANVGRLAEGKQKGQLDGSNKEIYERWGQAVSSAAGRVQEWMSFIRSVPAEPAYAAFVPALVVPDGTLWTVDYDENGAQIAAPLQTPQCSYYLGKTVPRAGTDVALNKADYMISHLMIYTLSALRDLVASLPTPERADRPCAFRDGLFPPSVLLPHLQF